MIREIVQVGDPVLREKCKPVTRFDEELCRLLDDRWAFPSAPCRWTSRRGSLR